MELGKKIRQLRFKAGLTQEQLAERMGVGAQSVSKWENAVSMPDISSLPLLAEVFGVSIDDLFDLSAEQRLNRIENRMDMEDELPPDVFGEYEDYLQSQLTSEQHKKRATELIAYLYWHRMNAAAQKVRRYAKDAIRMSPAEKGCQWMLNMAENHYIWDWNLSNHAKAIAFYRGIVEENPQSRLPYAYLLDNLIADHRADEAERYLDKLCGLEGANPVTTRVYRAYIALARFDEPAADAIIRGLIEEYPDDSVCLFEAAQYHAMKCDYPKAIELYERSFENEKRRPRFQDELHGIAEIFEIMGDYQQAAATYDRIIALLRDEWGMTEETALKDAQREKARLVEKAK
ncbi:MAG: helix-turn-helix domain-containing protein [Clostridia bacterium]|nr:helix-turn-helix domain-containing protein [Clostridia bacterium]